MSALLAVLLLSASAADAVPPRYQVVPLEWKGTVTAICPVDVDGDGLRDLVRAGAGFLEVRFQSKDGGFGPADAAAVLPIPDRAVGWCIAPLETGGRPGVMALIDGREVRRWDLEPGRRTFAGPRTLAAGLPGALPAGTHHLPFVRDLDGDGRSDLVIPGARRFHLRLGLAGGGFGPEIGIPEEIGIRSRLAAGDDLAGEIGQSVSIPLFSLRDLNGDGRPDLLTETKDRVEVYFAESGGGFPAAPAFALDLAAARAALGPNDMDSLDTSNITGALAKTAQAVFGDVDGDGIEDVVFRAGGKVSLFLGRKGGIDPARPDQVLKSSGNVVLAALDDEDGDGRPDLWLVRIQAVTIGDCFLWLIAPGSIDFDIFIYRFMRGRTERLGEGISTVRVGGKFAARPSRRIAVTIGDCFLWLIAPGSIDFDIFIYRFMRGRTERLGEGISTPPASRSGPSNVRVGGKFAARPSRRIAVTVRFPSLVSALRQAKDLRGKPDRGGAPSWSADLAGRGGRRDLMTLDGERIRAYLGRAPWPPPAPIGRANFLRAVLERFGYEKGKDEYRVDATNLEEFVDRLLGRPARPPDGAVPDLEVPLPGSGRDPGIHVLDLDGDGIDDLLLIYARSAEGVRGAAVLSRRG